jgi:transketolase
LDRDHVEAARQRCRRYRLRILDISQQVPAMHSASAFSCTEIVDVIYNELMRPGDTFIMSKGHGCMIQYVILEERGILVRWDLDHYCQPAGLLGCHPDYGVPGITASTGSLGHGLGMAVGMALADPEKTVYAVLSDGELQEGSTWEAVLMASSLGLKNLVAIVDANGWQSAERTADTHPTLYPISTKLKAFDWECWVVDGHSFIDILLAAIKSKHDPRPLMLIAETVKGKGVSFMENQPIWHYRSPSPEEYAQAKRELEA